MSEGPTSMTGAEVSLRTGVARDAAVLATFGAATFRASYAADTPRDALATFVGRLFGVTQQAAELADPSCHFLLAELAGDLVGYLLLRDSAPPPSVPGVRPLALDRLYVAAGHQGRGIGRRLLEGALEEATTRGHDVLWLTVWERNYEAIATYLRWGFHEVGEIAFDLAGEPQTDRLMVLPCRRRGSGG